MTREDRWLMPNAQKLQRYRELQRYVGWSDKDARRVRAVRSLLSRHFGELVEDFYAYAQSSPDAARVLQGGRPQLERLRVMLHQWLEELVSGPYDEAYVVRRWNVGLKHAEIGLDQVFTNAAMSRLRTGMLNALWDEWSRTGGDLEEQRATVLALSRLLDLDLAIIEDAYEGERLKRQRLAERTRMEAALHQEKQFSDRLIERAQAIVLVLSPSGEVIRFNPYVEQLTGISLEQAIGKDWFAIFVPPEERARGRELLLATTSSPRSGDTINHIVARDGRRRSVSWSSASLQSVHGETVAVLAVGYDVTELEEAQRRALQAERLAAIGQMITGLAHESRNALQRIQACAEMLEMEVEDNEEAIDLVRRIQSAQDHMHRLYDEVRGYAGPINLARESLALPDVWREAWDLLSPQRKGRDVRLVERIQCPARIVRGDRFRLVQVFRNLMENALAACSDPVVITVACRPSELEGARAVEVAVRDNGPGLDAEQRERIFQPFYTTKTKGTGLGMSIAQRIIEAHRGQMTVGDPEPPGTEILILLPQ